MKSRYVLLIFLLGVIFTACNEDYGNTSVKFPAPSNLKIEKTAATTLELTWEDNSKGEQGFIVERTVLGTSTTQSTTLGANTTSFTDENVPAATYKYSVYAYYKERKTDPISIVYQLVPVNDPQNVNVTINGSAVNISWSAASGTIDGYKVERKSETGSYSLLQTVDKNTLSVVDNAPLTGTVTYKVSAYQGDISSTGVEKIITYMAPAQIVITTLTNSYFQLTPNYTLTSDGGETCAVGVCWSTSPNPTINDSKNQWHVKLSSGSKAFSPAINLQQGVTYYMRAYATNSGGTSYSNQVSGSLQTEPSAINLSWSPMATVNANLPDEIRVYETNTQLNGRNFKAYYAIADMSTGNIELKTVMSSTARTPSAHITSLTGETVYVMTNGGYFGYNGSTAVSYSMVIDRGQKLADNIGALTRGNYSYAVTRGVFGVTQSQVPVMKWAVGNYAYDVPSPNVEGEVPQPSLSNTFPAVSTALNAYTAIGGAPVLLKNGKIMFDFTTTSSGKYMTNYELLQSDIFSSTIKPPRTAIGTTSDNKLILFICDGRQSFSDGATMLELAQILKSLGCVNALNLDGGGSTAMIAGGSLLNSPSDGSQRAVASVVAFVKRK